MVRKTKSGKSGLGKAASTVRKAARKVPGASSNPMTNLIIADVALRGGGRLLRHAVEQIVLGTKYAPAKAKNIVKGRSMTQTLIGTAVARIATRSIPGAILVGGALLAKTLFDRAHGDKAQALDGEQKIAKQAKDGRDSDALS
jgi:hypothetical protein